MKNIKLLFLIVILSFQYTLPAQVGNEILTDPNDKRNPFTFFYNQEKEEQYLPKILSQFYPSGNIGSRIGLPQEIGTYISPSFIDSIVTALIAISSGRTEISKNIWTFTISLCLLGMFLSGTLTFMAVNAGKETPGIASLKLIGKFVMIILLVQYIAASIPRTVISICDTITDDLGYWITGDRRPSASAVRTLTNKMLMTTLLQIFSYQKEVRDRIVEKYKFEEEKKNRVLEKLKESSSKSTQIFVEAESEIINSEKIKHISAAQIQELASEKFMKASVEAVDTFINGVKEALIKEGEPESVQEQILKRLTLDLSQINFPHIVIRSTIYSAVAMIAISIWALPISVLFWTIMFSLPSQWGFNNILFSGIKIILGNILAILLISAYTAATVNTEAIRQRTAISKFTMDQTTGSYQPNPDSSLSPREYEKMVNLVSNPKGTSDTKFFTFFRSHKNTTDIILLALLIISAPAQAAGIIQGANGIAENAKNAIFKSGELGGGKTWLGHFPKGTSISDGTYSSGPQATRSPTLHQFQSNSKPRPSQ